MAGIDKQMINIKSRNDGLIRTAKKRSIRNTQGQSGLQSTEIILIPDSIVFFPFLPSFFNEQMMRVS